MKTEEHRGLLLKSVQRDQRLSALSRTLMLYLLAANTDIRQTKAVKLTPIAAELGVTRDRAYESAHELAAAGYVRVEDDEVGGRLVPLWNAAEIRRGSRLQRDVSTALAGGRVCA